MLALTVVSNFGVAPQQLHDVDIRTTVSDLKARVSGMAGLTPASITLYRGAQYLAGSKTLHDAGVQDGAVLSMKLHVSKEARAKDRVKRLGGNARSTKHDIRSAATAVIAANHEEHNETRSLITPLVDDVAVVKDLLLGKERRPSPGRTDKERLKELRIQKRCMDNEISDLREREGDRLSESKRAAANELRSVAEVADGAVQIAGGDISTREEVATASVSLTKNYKAQKAVLAALDKQFRKSENPPKRKVEVKCAGAPKKARQSTLSLDASGLNLGEPAAASSGP
jgi:hypothetical protein